MYEDPIERVVEEIQSEIIKQDDEFLMYKVKQAVGYSVDKNELIKALKYDREQYEKGYHDGLNADKWIPVTDPPKEHGEYLVTIKIKEDYSYVDKLSYTHDLYSLDRFDFAGKKRAGWYDYDSECGYYEVNYVVAWMPLPLPCKAESEGKE